VVKLGDVLIGATSGRQNSSDITVCGLNGIRAEDTAIGALVADFQSED
jgi:ornithine cyclodeaminase/alanine dehydrogenase-like protein (mu-crystallin family)